LVRSRNFAVIVFLVAGVAAAQAPPLGEEARAFIEIHFLAAKRAESAGQFGAAAKEYQAILEKFPAAMPEIHHNLGLVLYFDRKCDAAVASLRQADKLRPGFAGTHLFLGMSYLCLEQPRKALPELLAAHKLRPSSESAAQLGLAYSGLDQPSLAVRYFRTALDQTPEKENALYLLGENYLRMARSVAEDLIAKNPDSRYDNLIIGRIFDAQEFYQVDAQAYLRAVKKDPWNAATLYRLARVLSILGLSAPSDALIQRYRQLLPGEPAPRFDVSTAAKPETAVGLATDYQGEIRSLPPVDPAALPPLPLLESGVNEALKKRLSGDPTGKWKRAVESLAANRLPEAIAALTSIPPAPLDWLPAYLTATAHLWSDDLDSAEKVLNSRPLASATSPTVQMLRWEVLEQLGRTYYGRLLEKYPDSCHAHLVKAHILDAQERPEALNEYKAAIAADPSQPGVRLSMADYCLANARISEALDACKQESELDPFSSDAKACLGRIYVDLRQPDEALGYLQAALKTSSGAADVHSVLGRAYELKDDPDKAVAEYKKALEIDPSLNKLHYFLAGLYRRLGKDDLAEKEVDLFQRAGAAEREQHVNFVQRYYGGGHKPSPER